MNIIEQENQYSSGVYAKRPVAIVRGEGSRVWDEAGNEYIDCVGGIGVASIGHCHPDVVNAIKEQSERIITCPELFYNDVRAELMAKLADVTPGSINRFFLANSGTEAVEGALKFARLATQKTDFIAFQRAFHGRTMGALTATHKKDYRDPFQPLLQGMTHVTSGDIDAFAAAVTDQTAAVLFEPIQGEGGVRPMDAGFAKEMVALCRERGVLIIADEVQTGFGRTGKWFACEHYDIDPDILCMAKALGGGVPIGAVGLSSRIDVIPKSVHGSTFGGNPLSAAAALATVNAIERDGLVQQAEELGAYFVEQLRAIESKKVRDIRGAGLMIGLELKGKVQTPLRLLQENHGICALLAGPTVIRFLPPLTITKEDIDRVVAAVRSIIA